MQCKSRAFGVLLPAHCSISPLSSLGFGISKLPVRWTHRNAATDAGILGDKPGTDSDTHKFVPATAEDIEEFQQVSQESLSSDEAERLTRAFADATTSSVDPDTVDTAALSEEAEDDENEDPDWYLKEADETQTQSDVDLAENPDWTPRWRRSASVTEDSQIRADNTKETAWLDTANTPWSIDDTQRWLTLERAERVSVVDVRPMSEWIDWVVVAEAPTRSRLLALAEGLTREVR
jgi:hypothetical protein